MKRAIKALAVSDTHGNSDSLARISREYGDFAYLFHLGDNVCDAVWLAGNMPGTKVAYVRGNCDIGSDAPLTAEVEIAGNRILLAHGHTLQVKHTYDRALYYAQERQAAAILFGHTHAAYTEYAGGIWLINPGSAGEDRGDGMSVCTLMISEAGIAPKIIKL